MLKQNILITKKTTYLKSNLNMYDFNCKLQVINIYNVHLTL